MFREVNLPNQISGKLFLHGMPGRHEDLENFWKELIISKISSIVCLASPEEIRSKSPSYAKALDHDDVPSEVIRFEIPDFGVPTDREAFWVFAHEVGEHLRNGNRLLIHCGAGIGRTGMLAECVLLAVGEEIDSAHALVKHAGSCAETDKQRELILWCASRSTAKQLSADEPTITCRTCGRSIDENPSAPAEIRIPCPDCGSMTRTIHITIFEKMTIGNKLSIKGRDAGGGKPFIEQVQGADLHRQSGQWRDLTRIIDRENDLYHEVVKDPKTGEVRHECREPLSEHRGHGAAKRSKPEPESGEAGDEDGR